MSWLPINRDSKFYDFIYSVTEIILAPIRLLIKKSVFANTTYAYDLSPLIALLLISGMQYFLRIYVV
jgi:YggT family protein